MMLAFILWLLIMTAITFVPLNMMKNGDCLNGRDLFFTFVGMLAMGLFSLVFIVTK